MPLATGSTMARLHTNTFAHNLGAQGAAQGRPCIASSTDGITYSPHFQRPLCSTSASNRLWPTAPADQRQLPGFPTPLIREHGVIKEMRWIALAIRAA